MPPPGGTAAESSLTPEEFRRFQDGDHQAMSRVVALYRTRLIGFLSVMTRSLELAEEASQDALIDLYRKRGQIVAPEKIRPWLFTAGKLIVMKEMGRKRHQLEQAVEEDVLAGLAPVLEAQQGSGLSSAQLSRALVVAIQQLGPEDQELITLRYFGELPIKEIAETLEMPMGSVGVKLSRALDKLKRCFDQMGLRMDDLLS